MIFLILTQIANCYLSVAHVKQQLRYERARSKFTFYLPIVSNNVVWQWKRVAFNAFTNQRTTDDTGGCCANSSESVNRVGRLAVFTKSDMPYVFDKFFSQQIFIKLCTAKGFYRKIKFYFFKFSQNIKFITSFFFAHNSDSVF